MNTVTQVRFAMHKSITQVALSLSLIVSLAACEQLGVETPAQTSARQEAEGKAVGGACRHAGRALEDCYRSSPKTSKAAIYTGWRDMDAYMRENKIDVVMTAEDAELLAEQKAKAAVEEKDQATEKPAEKAGDKPADGSNNKSNAKSAGKQS